ncbi:hypothetical protein [Leptospira wolffii]|uniref:hypothetical protein n=1 Tax=Leptospira wolffii TaxID=409998 RepID=UPI0018DE3982|nr:hypothetical protein [Leptospira wolffii]
MNKLLIISFVLILSNNFPLLAQSSGQICSIPPRGICVSPVNSQSIAFVQDICNYGKYVLSTGTCSNLEPIGSCQISKNGIVYKVHYLPFLWDIEKAKQNCTQVYGAYTSK